MSLKVAVCTAASLLLLLSGCGRATTEESVQPAPVQPETIRTAHPTVVVRLVTQTIITPAPTAVPAPSPTPVVPAMPIPVPSGPPYVHHTVSTGETLGYIATLYDADIAELVAMNKLKGPDALIQIDQALRVPIQISTVAPEVILLPDSEVVYGPDYVNFDIDEFVQSRAGYLSTYSERVDGQMLNGVEIIIRVSEEFSVGPRLLLSLLEYYGGWVINPEPAEAQLHQPLGPRNPRADNLYRALSFTANRINAGYYSYKRDGFWIFRLADRSRAITPSGLNAGTVGVQNILAIHSDQKKKKKALSPDGFMAVYQALFDDPFEYRVEPLVPINLSQPPLELPWTKGQGFYFTGGPHPAYADGSGWAAVDFGPPDVLGSCFYSDEPVTAAAPGVIVSVRQGQVQLDLDGDGHIQTGWVLFYLHVALDVDEPVQVGQQVETDDVIGYASCEGGLAEASHVHLARRYNGEWIEAGGPAPMNLSGWVVQPNLTPYDGTIKKGLEVRYSCECWEPNLNLIVNTETD